MMKLMPYPLLWLSLLAMWLLLGGTFSPAQVLLGAAIATIACWAVVPLEPPKSRLRRPGTILMLMWLVFADVVRSNIAVLRLIVTGRRPRSAFVSIPLSLTDANALAILSCIVTATPGSAWIHYDSRHNTVIIHVLDTEDDAAWVATLKRDYEQRLMEIFQ